jgi:anti-sigma regulatory factor (Ser/Thr protein kinase)
LRRAASGELPREQQALRASDGGGEVAAETVVLPADLTSASAARAIVDAAFASADGSVREVVRLLTTELVANVIRHAETEVRLTVDPGPPLRVEVHDGRAATDAFRQLIATGPQPPADGAPGGRGLLLLHRLASRIGLTDDPDGGKVVWFEMDT